MPRVFVGYRKSTVFCNLSNIMYLPKNTKTHSYYIGFDVHKETIAFAFAGNREGSVYLALNGRLLPSHPILLVSCLISLPKLVEDNAWFPKSARHRRLLAQSLYNLNGHSKE